jgi:ABC-type glycerol-3-phosphate transport system permease component
MGARAVTTPAHSLIRGLADGRRWWRLFVLLTMLIGALLMLLPLAWLVTSSLKLEHKVFQYPPQWIPNPARLMNYVEALTWRPFHLYVKNSLIILLLNEVAVLLSASFCAYGFARLEFRGRDLWFGVVMAIMMIPFFVLMIPSFVMFSRLGWVNTYLPLTVPFFFGGGAFNIFLLRQFFRTIPKELADAACIDGCSEFGIYWRIMLPLAKPALTTVAIFTFLNSWNDLIGPLLYINHPDRFTVALGLAAFRGAALTWRARWDLLMAASTAMTLPVIMVFLAGQRYFVQGVVMTGIKG